jgi:hypothetical protein
MDADRAFAAARDHYRKGMHLLDIHEIIPQEEQALHFSRAGAHFAAGNLALAMGRAQKELNVFADDDDDDDDENG